MRRIIIFVSLVFLLVVTTNCTPTQAIPTSAPPKPGTTAAAPAPTPTPSVRRGGTVRVGQARKPEDFDIMTHAIRGETAMLNIIYDPVLELDDNLKLIPNLAQSWEVSKDGKDITLKLVKGAKFHDGTDFNAAAVKANYDRLLAAKSVGTMANRLRGSIDSVDVVDDSTVKIHLKAPNSAFLVFLAEESAGIVSPAAVQKWGADYKLHPVGTGPFKFKEFVVDDRTVLEKNESYWKKGADGSPLPYIDGAIFKPVPDDAVRLINLKAGSLDLIEEIPFKDIAPLKDSKDVVYKEVVGTGNTFMAMRQDRPPFNNKALRQAIASAIDKEGIIKAVEMGTGQVAYNTVSPVFKELYDPTTKSWPYDVAKAKEKLKEAGIAEGFSFNFLTTNEPAHLARSTAIQAQLAKIGIDVKLRVVDTSQLISEIVGDGWTEAYYLYFYAGPHPISFTYNLLPRRLWGGSTYFWDNAQFIDAFQKATESYDSAEQKRYWGIMQKIVAEEVPVIYLSHPVKNVAMSPKLHFKPSTQRVIPLGDSWLEK